MVRSALPWLLSVCVVSAAQAQDPRATLNLRFPEVNFQGAPLGEVLDLVAQLAGTNLVVRWEVLEGVGVERDQPINLRVRNLRLSQVLWIVLNEAAPDQTKLGYRLDSDMLMITTAEQLGQEMVSQVYDVRDMLQPEIANPSFAFGRTRTFVSGVNAQVAEGAVGVQPQTGIISSGWRIEGSNPGGTIFIPRQGEVGLGGNQGGGIGVGGGGGGGGGADGQDVGNFSDQRMQELIDVLHNTIEPDSWRVNGGRGSVQAFNGLLIIRNTPLVHQQIGGAIRQP